MPVVAVLTADVSSSLGLALLCTHSPAASPFLVLCCICVCLWGVLALRANMFRACIYPTGEMPTSGELPTVLRFDRHQSFVEFGNGYALLMNCGGTAKEREHARYV